MKYPLFALAVLGTAVGAAHAQTTGGSLTLYGIADVSVSSEKSDKNSTKNQVSSGNWQGSRLGVKGEKELEGWIKKAEFTLENGFDISTGTTQQDQGVSDSNTRTQRFFGRQAWAGLSGDFGTVAAGRMYTPGGITADVLGTKPADLLSVGGAYAAGGSYKTNKATTVAGGYRSDNAASYISPKMAGLELRAQVSPESEGPEDTRLGEQFGAAANYKATSFGLIAGGSYTVRKDAVKGALAYVGYDFKVVDLTLAFNQDQVYDKDAKAYKSKKPTIGLVKLGVPIGADLKLGVSAAQAKDVEGSQNSDDADMFSLQALYNLQKTTSLYAIYTDVKNKGEAKKGFNSPDAGNKSNVVHLGLRHQF